MRAPLAIVLLLLAGCAAPGTQSDPVDGPLLKDQSCDAPRPALAHRGNETLGPAPANLCVFRTGYRGTESTLGICHETGTVFAGPVVEDGAGGALLRTLDRGATWDTVYPTLQDRGTHQSSLDPYVHVDPNTCRVFFDDLTSPNCSLLSWTDDAGETWEHSAAGCGNFDHQTLFTGPPVSSPTVGYANIVYRCAMLVFTSATSVAATCQRSLDGGLTWMPPGAPAFVTDPSEHGYNGMLASCDGATGHGIADADGRIYLPKGCSQPRLAWSDDEGLTWTRSQVADAGMSMSPEGSLDHEGAVAVDANRTLYYAWIAADHLPRLAVSQDRGASWSDPIALAPPGLVDSALPTLAVTPEGRVAVTYYGSYDVPPYAAISRCEEDPQGCLARALLPTSPAEGSWSGHVAFVVDALSSSPSVWTSTTSDEPLMRGACGPVRCQGAFDFQDVQFSPDGAAWATFVDGEHQDELIIARLV